MITYSPKNFFEFTEDELCGKAVNVVLVDKKFSLSGELMKQYNYRLPQVIHKMKEQAAEQEIAVGNCFLKNGTLFIVARSNPLTKWNAEVFEKIWKGIRDSIAAKFAKIKFSDVDYPWIVQSLYKFENASSSNIIMYERCGWEF